MSDAVRYRRYLLDLLEPHCGRTIMEVGSGLGDLAADLKGYDRLFVTDVDPTCLSELSRRFAERPEVEVRRFDLREDDPAPMPMDTVLAVNVLEHINDDVAALRRMAAAIVPGGTVVLFVPGYPSLYGPCDRAVGHVRRYLPKTLRSAVLAARLGRRAAPTRQLPRWRRLVDRRARRGILESQEQSGRTVRRARGAARSSHGAAVASTLWSVDPLCGSGAGRYQRERVRCVRRGTLRIAVSASPHWAPESPLRTAILQCS